MSAGTQTASQQVLAKNILHQRGHKMYLHSYDIDDTKYLLTSPIPYHDAYKKHTI
jgi:hypothetical protein